MTDLIAVRYRITLVLSSPLVLVKMMALQKFLLTALKNKRRIFDPTFGPAEVI
jgi:hypothetical protein